LSLSPKVVEHGFAALMGRCDSKKAAEALFGEIDDNGGGIILLDEWCEFLKKGEVAAGTEVGKLLALDEAGGVCKPFALAGKATVLGEEAPPEKAVTAPTKAAEEGGGAPDGAEAVAEAVVQVPATPPTGATAASMPAAVGGSEEGHAAPPPSPGGASESTKKKGKPEAVLSPAAAAKAAKKAAKEAEKQAAVALAAIRAWSAEQVTRARAFRGCGGRGRLTGLRHRWRSFIYLDVLASVAAGVTNLPGPAPTRAPPPTHTHTTRTFFRQRSAASTLCGRVPRPRLPKPRGPWAGVLSPCLASSGLSRFALTPHAFHKSFWRRRMHTHNPPSPGRPPVGWFTLRTPLLMSRGSPSLT
jgi:hypothetical protein